MSITKREPILFTTVLQGTRFNIKIFKDQPIEAHLTQDVDSIKITGPVPRLTKLPVESLFISSDYNINDGTLVHINDYVPLMGLEDKLLDGLSTDEKGKLDKQSVEYIEYLAQYSVESENFTEERFNKFLDQIKDKFKFEFDLEKFKEELEKKRGVVVNIKRVIKKKYPAPKEEDCGFYINPDVWELAVRNYLRSENTLFTGPTGSGKTELIALIAATLGVSINIQDMGTVQDAQSALLGVHRLNDEGHSIFDPAPFVSHVQQEGILLLDELNRAPLAANNILFPCLDRRRYLPLDIASSSESRKVKVHDKAVFFATANIGAEYSGVFSIDRALYDRFMPIELDYPNENAEARVLVLRTGIEKRLAGNIVKCCANLRKQYKDGDVSNTVSVRHSLQVAQLVVDGFKMDQAMMAVFLPLFENGANANSERAKVKSIIAAF